MFELHHVREAVTDRAARELPDDLKWAAVAAVFRGDPLEVLLIQRAHSPSDPWSGHMAFPGGRFETEDESLLVTARRETLEEVGLALGEPMGRLDDLQAVSRAGRMEMGIRPFVFEVRGDPTLTLDRSEVASHLWTPIASLRSEAHATRVKFERNAQSYDLPGVDLGGGKILWGLTYRMLQSLIEIL